MNHQKLTEMYLAYVDRCIQENHLPKPKGAWQAEIQAAYQPAKFSITLYSEALRSRVTFQIEAPTLSSANITARKKLAKLEQQRLEDQGGGATILTPQQQLEKLQKSIESMQQQLARKQASLEKANARKQEQIAKLEARLAKG
jgi:hypothetical protein